LNGLAGDIFLLAGKGFALDYTGNNIELNSTVYNTQMSQTLSSCFEIDVYKKAIAAIFRYQMCIYHFMNQAFHRALSVDDLNDLGYYPQYLGVKARWNNYVFTSFLSTDVRSTLDSIFITMGFTNTFSTVQDVTLTATITPLDSDPNLVWYGIFISELSPIMADYNNNSPNNSEELSNESVNVQITRKDVVLISLDDQVYKDYLSYDDTSNDGGYDVEAMNSRLWLPDPLKANDPEQDPITSNTTTEAQKIINRPLEDITNPNNCAWSPYGGSWSSGQIIQKMQLQPKQSCKYVYSIEKHPSVTGNTERTATKMLFNIDIKCEFSGKELTKHYKNVPCYMQQYTNDDTDNNKGNTKRYILVATADTGVYQPATS
jgi:hypothetical protein